MEKLKEKLKRVGRTTTEDHTEKFEEEGEYVYATINNYTTHDQRHNSDEFQDVVTQNEETKNILMHLKEQAALPITNDKPLDQQPWYHSDLDRGDVGSLLLGEGATSMGVCDGTFLVRPSHSGQGHVLSVREEGEIRHMLLHRTPFGLYRWQPGQEFDSLPALLNYYISHPSNTLHLTTPYTKDMAKAMYSWSKDPWEISVHSLDLREHLGSGQYGIVRRAKWKHITEVAVKILQDGTVRSDVWQEVQYMRRLRHPNLIKLYGVVSRSTPFMIVMEYMNHGPLATYLLNNQMTRVQCVSVLVGVCAGMSYLAEQQVVHRDLAARNILLGKHLTVKIADFGLSRVLKDDIYERTTPTKVAYRWLSIEAFERGTFSSKSDVWAFGVLAWEVFTRASTPYYELKTRKEVWEFVQSGGRLSRPSSCPPEAWHQFMAPCWHPHPHLRPDFTNLLNFLRHWQEVEEKPRSARVLGKISLFNK